MSLPLVRARSAVRGGADCPAQAEGGTAQVGGGSEIPADAGGGLGESDRLSLILSKAFLLAADTKITDESILTQIKPGA